MTFILLNMNSQISAFDKPIAVVQVFTNTVEILKPQWRSGHWRDLGRWKPVLRSMTGWVSNDRVVLNETILEQQADLYATDVLLLIDANNYMHVPPPIHTISDFPGGLMGWQGVRPMVAVDAESPAHHGARFYHLSRWSGVPVHYSSYGLLRTNSGIELHLAGSRGTLNPPRRGDFKVAELPKGVPIRVLINGKRHSGHWPYREEQVYQHCDDIFIYLGDCHRFEVYPWNEMLIEKPVPLAGTKIINLERDLY